MAIFRILAMDGGGVKGLFTATLLERIAEAHPGLLERADLLAGTSSGGILALGAAAGRTPAELVWLFRSESARVFADSFLDDVVDIGKVVGADYDARRLRAVLRRELGAKRLRDLGKRVLVPAFDLDSPARDGLPRMWRAKFFHNFPGSDSDGSQRALDVALATSAAPTYFPTYQGYVDGGVVANNPALAGLALALDPRAAGRRLDDVVVLSLGTGIEPKRIAGQRLDWGWGQWARPLVELMVGGVSGVVDFQCRQILGERYRRVDAVFEHGVALDDVRPATLDFLAAQAAEVDLAPVAAWLRRQGW